MTTETDSASTEFGPHLRQLREKAGLSVQDLSRRTRIPEATLAALESDQLEKLPPETYVRGFIRNYARAVQTTASEPLERYERTVAAARAVARAASDSAEGGQRAAGRRRRVMAAVVGLLLALSAAAFALWQA
jgi:cytoskeleton protein RodZ